jgi:hypothetical protein
MITARLMQFSSSRTFPGQGVPRSPAQHLRAGHRAAILFGRETPDEGMRQQARRRRSGRARAECYHDFSQAIVQILAETPLADQRLEILVRRADDAYIDRDLVGAHRSSRSPAPAGNAAAWPAANAADRRSRRASGCRCWPSRSCPRRLRAGTGKGALLVTKELAFQQVLRNRRAVDGDEALARRGDDLCTARARSSLPVPLSPSSSTVASLTPTRSIVRQTRSRSGSRVSRPDITSGCCIDCSRSFSFCSSCSR